MAGSLVLHVNKIYYKIWIGMDKTCKILLSIPYLISWPCSIISSGSAELCLPSKSMFVRPKMIAPSWPKVVQILSLMVKILLPVDCQLACSWLYYSKTDGIIDLLLLLMLQH